MASNQSFGPASRTARVKKAREVACVNGDMRKVRWVLRIELVDPDLLATRGHGLKNRGSVTVGYHQGRIRIVQHGFQPARW